MKLLESPNCPICEIPQDNEHIFNTCQNAIIAEHISVEIISQITDIDATLLTNIQSLIKRQLFINKNTPLNEITLRHILNLRISDLATLKNHKKRKKLLAKISH